MKVRGTGAARLGRGEVSQVFEGDQTSIVEWVRREELAARPLTLASGFFSIFVQRRRRLFSLFSSPPAKSPNSPTLLRRVALRFLFFSTSSSRSEPSSLFPYVAPPMEKLIALAFRAKNTSAQQVSDGKSKTAS